MKLDTTVITTKLAGATAFLRRHLVTIIIAAFGLLYMYILWQVSVLTSTVPSDKAVTDQLKAVPRPKIDEKAAQTMQGLEDQNVKIQTIFDEARENPFTE